MFAAIRYYQAEPPSVDEVEYDGMVIYEAPDDATAGAVVLAAARHKHLRATKTTPLFTSEESMAVMRRAGTAAFRAPRQLR